LQRDIELIDRLFNYYAYVGNNPLGYNDPFGKQAGPGDIAPRPGELAQARGNHQKAAEIAAERFNREKARIEEQRKQAEEKATKKRKERQERIIRSWNKLRNTIAANSSDIIDEANRILKEVKTESKDKCITTLPNMPDVAEQTLADIFASLLGIHPYQFMLVNLMLGRGLIFVGPETVDSLSNQQLFNDLAFEFSHLLLGHSNLLGSLFGSHQEQADTLADFISKRDP
jgi:hypothetical protein